MIQLFFIGMLLYAMLSLLAKWNLFSGITRILTVVNYLVIVVLAMLVLVKTGLFRMLATSISFLLILFSEWIAELF